MSEKFSPSMAEKKEAAAEKNRASLETIALAEYQHLPAEVQEWLQTNEDVPEPMWDLLKGIDRNLTLLEVMKEIRAAFSKSCGRRKPNYPMSFEESRFTSFQDIVTRNLRSCGIRTRVYGVTLRKLGVPVHFIDGKRENEEITTDHAWLEIYSPKERTWIECDPGEPDFVHSDKNKKERVFHDWEELKSIHEKKE